jgi:hypothetical protein
MSKEEEFERRLTAVEQEVAELRRRLADVLPPQDWISRLAVRDVEGFEEVLKYGREFRYADRPQDEDSGRS